jgi:predicted anti-sigma-YlaC factor YlaD
VTPEDDLSCQEIVELVTAYLEGVLAPADRERVEQHLSGCEGCLTYVDQVRRTIRIVGALREDDLGPRVREELVGAFRGWRGG